MTNTFVGRRSVVGLAVLPLLLAACSITRPVTPPQVSVQSVRLGRLGLKRQIFHVKLRAQNANPWTLAVRQVHYRLELAGVEVATGVSSEAFTLPANGTASYPLRVETDLLDSVPRLLSQLDGGPVHYRLSGQLDLGAWLPDVPFSESGDIRLAR